jgi:hypothetical protein
VSKEEMEKELDAVSRKKSEQLETQIGAMGAGGQPGAGGLPAAVPGAAAPAGTVPGAATPGAPVAK